MAGIVHFSNYFAWMEQAEHEAWRSLGLGVMTEIGGETVSWPRVAAECDFRRAIRFEDLIDVQLGLSRIGNRSLTWRVRFFHDGILVAEGSMTAVCCTVEPGRPPVSREIPARIRPLLDGLLWTAE